MEMTSVDGILSARYGSERDKSELKIRGNGCKWKSQIMGRKGNRICRLSG